MVMPEHYELKLAFAASLLRNNNDAAKAAFAVCPTDMGMALQIASILGWANDPVVVAEKERLLGSTDAKSFLPTKEQQARDIYTLATSETVCTEDRLKAHRLYAEVMGHIEKQAPANAINVLNQGVMIVREAPSDEVWEQRAIAQQRALTANATVN